jgi:hypothetical protein
VKSRRAPTIFDAALLAAIVVAAVSWTLVSSPGLQGSAAFAIAAIAVLAVFLMIVVTAWEVVTVHRQLSRHFSAMIRTILRTRKDLLPLRWRTRREDWVGRVEQDVVSALLFFLVFLAYFSIMLVFFYGLGGQLLADPPRLMIAAFLGTAALHFSGSGEIGNALTIVLNFLVPFGIIVGFIDLSVIGPIALLSWAMQYGPVLLVFFAAYYGLDVAMEQRTDRVGRRETENEGGG